MNSIVLGKVELPEILALDHFPEPVFARVTGQSIVNFGEKSTSAWKLIARPFPAPKPLDVELESMVSVPVPSISKSVVLGVFVCTLV